MRQPTTAGSTPVNEIDRLVVRFPDPRRRCWDHTLGLAIDERDGQKSVSVVTASPERMRLAMSLAALCDTRVLQVHDGDLLVNGRAMRPENYLDLWQPHLKSPIEACDLPARGVRLRARVQLRLSKARERTHVWSQYRIGSLAQLEAEFERCVRVNEDFWSFEADLCDPALVEDSAELLSALLGIVHGHDRSDDIDAAAWCRVEASLVTAPSATSMGTNEVQNVGQARAFEHWTEMELFA